ncbi:MAG TPA: shikimate dehydrogenase [Candidatus Limnocylindrales bacterium]|nr:shikimate dehydrogenase [Candidatus Limnocylindrales bacterium]
MGYLVGLIGSGIGASLSPALHEREADTLGLRYVYKLIDLDRIGRPPASVPSLVRQALTLGFTGLNITYPGKQLVMGHLDSVSAEAARIGAVNTITFSDGRAIGHNTDWSGFAESFAGRRPDVSLDRVVLVGAGGAGSAIAYALRHLGVKRLTIVDLSPSRASELAHRYPGLATVGAPEALLDADGVVNCSPVGMVGHPGIPIDPSLLRPSMWVADVVYRPLETELLKAAKEIGCRTLHGGGMAVGQAAAAFELFTGERPDRDRMLRHFAELVRVPTDHRPS